MNIEEYFDKIKSIQSEFLEFIENDENVEGNFQNLFLILEDKKIRYNKHDLRLFLHHVASISANHRRGKNFFAKIERVIQIFKSEIRKYYLNSEIFSIFKRDKRILLFLIEEKILIFDEYVARKMINEKYVKKKYPQYFAPEISAFKDQHWFPRHGDDSKNEWIDEINKKLPDRFHELRKIGENERYICELIRNDNVIDFVTWVCRSNFPLESQIELSIYETNSFLLKDQKQSGRNNNSESSITLMEYAAFFGSTKIIKYLQMEGVEMTPSLCLYSIHSQNVRLIHFLEDCQVEQKETAGGAEEESYKVLFWESIKCNHNRIADYFLNNYIQNGDQISNEIFIRSLKYYNFEFLQKEPVNESSFCRLCAHDYYLYVDDLLKNKGININSKIIRNHIFQYYLKSYLLMKLKIISFNYIQNHIFQ
ncbi:hypothetical protein M9Y10_027653 [Tritrichomonas musculus]|uniref:DUF3447 domain-containing protein n=1 Tax=Tritrichomonas musculus TaxID=1915356 RepID=A0ABR2H5H9_9EUKA